MLSMEHCEKQRDLIPPSGTCSEYLLSLRHGCRVCNEEDPTEELGKLCHVEHSPCQAQRGTARATAGCVCPTCGDRLGQSMETLPIEHHI